MSLLQIVVLALVQGITEFLPISSSGHLALVPYVTGWPDQGLAVDVAVHVGTLGAVALYFWREVLAMAGGTLRLAQGRWDPGARLALYVVVGTIPVIAAGLAVKVVLGDTLRSATVIAWSSIVFGVVLWLTDRFGPTPRRLEGMGMRDAVIIGLSQVLALISGTSRSGITMSAARMMGFDRTEAARFSMLLSIPAILGSGVVLGKDLVDSGNATLTADAALAAGLAFVTALVAIALMMAWLRRATFTPFVVYRIVLGVVLLGIIHGGAG